MDSTEQDEYESYGWGMRPGRILTRRELDDLRKPPTQHTHDAAAPPLTEEDIAIAQAAVARNEDVAALLRKRHQPHLRHKNETS